MPEIKISQLTSASTPAGTEVLAIVQSGDTKKTTINSLASALEVMVHQRGQQLAC